MNDDLSVTDVLDCYSLSPEHRATLELVSVTDDADSLEKLEPILTSACRALRDEANAEAAFNERYQTQA